MLTAALLQLAGYATGETESELTRTGECDATDMFCFADDPMKSTVVRIAKSIFLFVVYLSICMTVANIYVGKRRARDTFTCFALLGMVVIQYYTLWIASMKSFPLRGTDIVRYDCKQSNKGDESHPNYRSRYVAKEIKKTVKAASSPSFLRRCHHSNGASSS